MLTSLYGSLTSTPFVPMAGKAEATARLCQQIAHRFGESMSYDPDTTPNWAEACFRPTDSGTIPASFAELLVQSATVVSPRGVCGNSIPPI